MNKERSFRILIVEDERPLAQHLEHRITSESSRYQVVGLAANGKEALELMPTLKPDIVFTDINMPVMDGLAFLAQATPKYPNVKFVLLHCYPYFSQCGLLAQLYGNVYADCSWLAIVSPNLFETAIAEWIGYVPPGRICFSADATHVEQTYSSYSFMRDGLARVLEEKIARGHMDENSARLYAERLLRGNNLDLYFR